MALRDCASRNAGEESVTLNAAALTPNDQYFIRIANFGGDALEGDFTICIEEMAPTYTIDEDGSTDCNGTLYDTGVPDGDYSGNENNVFTICPDEIHQCLVFNLEYFNIAESEFGFGGDAVIFYNGANVNAPIIGTIGDPIGSGDTQGGGGVCYTVAADNCLTIQMFSDGSVELEGFAGYWECFLEPCEEIVPITIEENPPNSEIENSISSALADVTVSNIECPEGSFGTFESGINSDLGLGKGLILSSGSAVNAIGPNTSMNIATMHFTAGDADLDLLSDLLGNGTLSNDACVIELDVLATSSTLKFEYIFGSEEYPEWAPSDFNDIFALLISSPEITDGVPQIGGQKNLAVLPTTGEFVTINNVNNNANYLFYRNNAEGQSIGCIPNFRIKE